jgi:hypothetical protein
MGVGVEVGDGSAGTGEMADRTAGCAAELSGSAAEDAAADAWTATDDVAGELAAPDPAAAEPTAAELAAALPVVEFRSAGLLEDVQAASAENAAIAMTIWVRRAVLVRRAIPHAATPGCEPGNVTAAA